jgi:hypothetical protein
MTAAESEQVSPRPLLLGWVSPAWLHTQLGNKSSRDTISLSFGDFMAL